MSAKQVQPKTIAGDIVQRIQRQKFKDSLPDFDKLWFKKKITELKKVDPKEAAGIDAYYSVFFEKNKQQVLEKIQHYASLYAYDNIDFDNIATSYENIGEFELAIEYSLKIIKSKNPDNVDILRKNEERLRSLFYFDHVEEFQDLMSRLQEPISLEPTEFYLCQTYFADNRELFSQFGLGCLKIINRFLHTKFILGQGCQIGTAKYEISDEITFHLHINGDNKAEKIAQINSALSEFIVDFEEKNNLDLDNLVVYAKRD